MSKMFEYVKCIPLPRLSSHRQYREYQKLGSIDFAYLVGPQGNLSTTFCAASHITIVADMSNSISEFCSQANLAGRI